MKRLAFLFASMILTACASEGGNSADAPTVSDSAGIRIIRNGAVGLIPQAVLDSPTLALRIGTADGDSMLQFFRPGAMAVDDSGFIYVADGGHYEVRVFDAEGRFVRRFGGRGSGPGEFQGLNALHVFGDTVVVLDLRVWRLVTFNRHGVALGTQTIRDSNGGRISIFARSDGGWLLTPPRDSPFDPHGVERRDTVRLVWASSIAKAMERWSGSAGAEVPPDTTAQRYVLTLVSGRRYGNQTPLFLSSITPLFEPAPTYAADGRGNVYYTDAASYVIDVYDTHGRHTRRITRAHSPIPITDEVIGRVASLTRAYWDTASLGGEGAAGKSNDEATLALPHVASLSPIGTMLASRNGSLWVERIDLHSDPVARQWGRGPTVPEPSKWDLFDPEGQFLGTVTFPPNFIPRVAGDRWMLGRLRDEMDIPYIARFALVTPE
jgi:hypothetical protein